MKYTVPIASDTSLSTKDKIIIILSDTPNLSIRKIHFILKKRFATNVTYQAVHKLVKQMIGNGILVCDNHEYSINLEWIEQLKIFIEKTIRGSEMDSSDSYTTPHDAYSKVKALDTNGMINFSFSSFKDLDNFVNSVEKYYLEERAKEGDEITSAIKHARYPIQYPDYKKNLLNLYKKNKIKYFILCEGDTILDVWAVEFFMNRNIGLKTNVDHQQDCDELHVFKDIIIKIYLPEEIRSRLEEFFSQVTSLTDFYPDIFLKELKDEKFDIKVNIQRNSFVADRIRSTLKNYYLDKEFSREIDSLKVQRLEGLPFELDSERRYVTKKQVTYYRNLVVPYLSQSETVIINREILSLLPKKIYKGKKINLYNLGAEVGLKAQKVLINFYRKYGINFNQISLTDALMNESKNMLTRFSNENVKFNFASHSLKTLDEFQMMKKKKEPGVFLLLDYVYGNYDPDVILKPLSKVIGPDDLLVISLQFIQKSLSDEEIKKVIDYYQFTQYYRLQFDCAILMELGFRRKDLELKFEFNKKKSRLESYSLIKNIPDGLMHEVDEVGLKKGDKVLNFFSRKPTPKMLEKEISPYFKYKAFVDEDTNVGVLFARKK